jgi:tRNA (cmo5U34)-methyltransferase
MTAVETHLGIDLAEYDRRIRTFIPHYEDMLDAAASAVAGLPRDARLLELGVGTGGLATRCLARLPGASFVGIDADPQILAVARRRLARRAGGRAAFVAGDFARLPLPPCEGVLASLALHHVRTRPGKRRLYGRCFDALTRGGLFVNADVHLPSDPRLRALAHAQWRAHLEATYPAADAEAFLRGWAQEDVYVRLDHEAKWLADAGFHVDVIWRRGCFAVLAGRKA